MRNSSSVPNSGSIAMLIRSKWPSMLGVWSQPVMPPASFSGPVWRPSMPIFSNASHSSSDPSDARNVVPRPVMCDRGYAVYQTDVFCTAERGFGSAYEFDHMRWLPASWRAIIFASMSIDCSSSHVTYAGLRASAANGGGGTTCSINRRFARGRSFLGRAGYLCAS